MFMMKVRNSPSNSMRLNSHKEQLNMFFINIFFFFALTLVQSGSKEPRLYKDNLRNYESLIY